MSATDPPFDPRTMLWAVLASLMAAAGFFLLSTYAPDFRMIGQGGATPSSKSATGFAGLMLLLSQTDAPPELARDGADLDRASLLIVPLAPDTPAATLKTLIAHRTYKATLYVLPKWAVAPLPTHPGWDIGIGPLPLARIDRVLRQIAASRSGRQAGPPGRIPIDGVAVRAPDLLQWVADSRPLIAVAPGHALLAKEDGAPHYILADPDLLDNQGLADRDRAAAALRIIAGLKPNADPVMFDLTLLGAGKRPSRSLEKLLIEPPFLALTLALLVVAALAFAHGFVRFGPPRVEARAIAFGKYALADTTARLFRRAGRLGQLGGRYASLLRARAGRLLGAPAGLTPAALTQWLDARVGADEDRFGDLAAATEAANGESALHTRAQALHDWIRRRMRDR